MKKRPIRENLLSGTGSGDRLLAARCPACSQVYYPRNGIYCIDCTDESLEPIELSGLGTLHSYTHCHVASEFFEPPYVCGYVELDDGPLVFAPLRPEVDDAELAVGMPVEIVIGEVWRTDNESVIGYHFRPLDANDNSGADE